MSANEFLRRIGLLRSVDLLVWGPVLLMISLFRRKRALPAVRGVGLMMFETIGDTVLGSSLVNSLRASLDPLSVTLFVSSGNRDAAGLIGGVDRIVEVPLMRPLAALRAMRSAQVDVLIDIGQWPRWYAFLCAVSRSRFTIGFATPRQFRHLAYDAAVEHRADVHELDNMARLLTPLPGVLPRPPGISLPAPDSTCPVFAAPYVVLHPGAGGFRSDEREWPVAHWRQLVSELTARGLGVVISGGKVDTHKATAIVRDAAFHERVVSVAGEVTLAQLCLIMKSAACVVAVNTGVMHIAAVLDLPLVALHGPTSRRRWGPIGTRSVGLAPAPGPDVEFLNLGFEYPRYRVECMQRIGVDEVLAAVRLLLDADDGAG
jgi:heptosyltransferase III